MSGEKRPGGLTALAVINFVIGGFGVLGALGTAAILPLMRFAQERADTANMTPQQQAQIEALTSVSGTLFIILAIASLITAILLITSGVGYLKLKKFLGRTLGNVYAVLSIVYAIVSAFMMPEVLGGGFRLAAIIGLIYPVVTLFLLNTIFKEDFVN